MPVLGMFRPYRSQSVAAALALRMPEALSQEMTPEEIMQLRESCVYLESPSPGGSTAQIISHIRGGNEQAAISVLEQKGLEARPRDEVGLSLYHHAAGAGMLNFMDRLYEQDKGAGINDLSIMDESPLSYAILLNAAEPSYEPHPHEPAQRRGDLLAVVDWMLGHGAQVFQEGRRGHTAALHTAAIGDMAVMEKLHERADIRLPNHMGETVTHESAASGHYKMLEQFQQWGIDPRQRDHKNIAPMDLAQMYARDGRADPVLYGKSLFILARGCVIAEACDIAGVSLQGHDLTMAIDNINAFREVYVRAAEAQNNYTGRASLDIICQMQGIKGTDMNDPAGYLLLACANGHTEHVQNALLHGFRATSRDLYGYTPLMLLAANKHHQAMPLLVQDGASLDDQNALLETALHLAATVGNREGVKSLLSMGANPLVQDWRGLTPRQKMVWLHQPPVADTIQPQQPEPAGARFDIAEAVLAQMEVRERVGPASAMGDMTASPQQDYGYDPVIHDMLTMAESRWLSAERNYQRFLQAAASAVDGTTEKSGHKARTSFGGLH